MAVGLVAAVTAAVTAESCQGNLTKKLFLKAGQPWGIYFLAV
jgi:hypothetical protein